MSNEPNIDDCDLIDEHDQAPGDGMDDGYSIALYKTSDGKHFIHIVHSDYSSKYNGALGFDQWVTDAQISGWKSL